MFYWEYQETLRYVKSEHFYSYAIPWSLVGCLFVLNEFMIKIKAPITKKWISTLLGIVAMLCFCGLNSLHVFLMVLGNSLIIQFGCKRWCNMISFIFCYSQLATYYSMNYQNHHIWGSEMTMCTVIMFMFCKMVNLAGEVQETYLSSQNKRKTTDPRMNIYADIRIDDVFHYSFCHASLCAMYRYRTYYDWLHSPLHVYAKRVQTAVLRALEAGLLLGCHYLILHFTPKEYILSDEFSEKPFIHKFLHSTICGAGMFFLAVSAFKAFDLSCIASGMGVYPTATKPRICAGPTTKFDLLDKISRNPEKAQLEEYTFETVCNVKVVKCVFAPTARDFWRNYNCCSQYFFGINVYKKFPLKRLRLFATFVMSALWHGYYLGWYIALISIAIYIEAEDIWISLFRNNATGIKRKIIDVLFWLPNVILQSHMFLFPILLQTSENIYHNFTGIYFLPVIYPVAMLTIGTCIRYVFYKKKYE